MSIQPKVLKSLPDVSTLSKKSPFKQSLDISSINVRKFNLPEDNNQDCNNTQSVGPTGSDKLRVCMPIFSNDILKSFNDLDINSTVSKSLSHSKQKLQQNEINDCVVTTILMQPIEFSPSSVVDKNEKNNSDSKISNYSSLTHADLLIHNLLAK